MMRLLLIFSLFFNAPAIFAQNPEICTNGLDDDGDGFVDCEDLDCLSNSYQIVDDLSGVLPYGSGFASVSRDFNSDGYLDLVLLSNNDTSVLLNHALSNSGRIKFEIAQSFTGLNSYDKDVESADFDGDGDFDVFITSQSLGNRIFINLGGAQGGVEGQFEAVAIPGNAWELTSGDIDGDGDVDLYGIRPVSSQSSEFYINQGGLQNGIQGEFEVVLASSTSSHWDCELVDLDNDSDLDLLYLGFCNGYRLNLGGQQGGSIGTYSNQYVSDFGCDVYKSSCLIGDHDSDGDQDVFIYGYEFLGGADSPVERRLYVNQGGIQNGVVGDFELSAQDFGLGLSSDAAYVDIDGDSDFDLLVTEDRGGVSTWVNQGGIQDGVIGEFLNTNSLTGLSGNTSFGSGYRSSIEVGDYDLDGFSDLFINSSFKAAWRNQNCRYHEVCDNGFDDNYDGLIDCDDPGCNGVQFENSGQFLRVYFNTSISAGVVVEDFNNDGSLDSFFAYGGSGYSTNRVFLGSSNLFQHGPPFCFSWNGNGSSGQGWSTGLATADFNQDGLPDVATSQFDFNGQGNNVLINVGVASGALSTSQSLGESKSTDIDQGDFDGDGDIDLFVVNTDGQSNKVWLNQGNLQNGVIGDFSDSGQALGDSNSVGLAVGDIDDDFDLDAIVVNESTQDCVLWVNQDGLQGGIAGVFQKDFNAPIINAPDASDALLADFDNDGDLDLLILRHAGLPNKVYWNEGGFQGGTAGHFIDSNQVLGDSSSNRAAFGDLDNDGDLDLFVANTGANKVWINDGFGYFSDSGLILEDSDSSGVALRDLNSDGFLDAVISNSGSLPGGTVWFNESSQFCFDSDLDGIPNECDIDWTIGEDCDSDGQDDSCQNDQDADGVIDPCDEDLDGDGIPNNCDLDLGGEDCNLNGIADNCDADLNSDEIPDDCQDPLFRRGDPNGDGSMDIGDGVTVLGYLFGSTSIDCFDAGDSNDDGNLNIADAITILSALFTGGDSPPEPGPASCDLDPTADSLGCESYGNCS